MEDHLVDGSSRNPDILHGDNRLYIPVALCRLDQPSRRNRYVVDSDRVPFEQFQIALDYRSACNIHDRRRRDIHFLRAGRAEHGLSAFPNHRFLHHVDCHSLVCSTNHQIQSVESYRR